MGWGLCSHWTPGQEARVWTGLMQMEAASHRSRSCALRLFAPFLSGACHEVAGPGLAVWTGRGRSQLAPACTLLGARQQAGLEARRGWVLTYNRRSGALASGVPAGDPVRLQRRAAWSCLGERAGVAMRAQPWLGMPGPQDGQVWGPRRALAIFPWHLRTCAV